MISIGTDQLHNQSEVELRKPANKDKFNKMVKEKQIRKPYQTKVEVI